MSVPRFAVWLMIPVLCLAFSDRAWSGETDRFSALTSEIAERIDSEARKVAVPVRPSESPLENYTNASAFLLSRLSLPMDEEHRRALLEVAKLEERFPVVDVSPLAAETFQRLIEYLPAELIPDETRFRLVAIRDPGRTAFTQGAGRVYLCEPFLSELSEPTEANRGRLAFVIARELGHLCRQHVRRRYQLQWLIDEAGAAIDEGTKSKLVAEFQKLCVAQAGRELSFHYAPEEELQADRFAWQLCRNAGFDGSSLFDPLRAQILAASERDEAEERDAPLSTLQNRLRILLAEREGTIVGRAYGLFAFDPVTGDLRPLNPNSVAANRRVTVVVHGMGSSPKRFCPLTAPLATKQSVFLAFNYPNDGSLEQAGRFLASEIRRVTADASDWDFLCHSAGGLVFRWYAEIEGGAFRRAVMTGTPQSGSSLTRLRSFLELSQVIGDLRVGLSESLRISLADSQGRMGEDLATGSLFLDFLNRPRDTVAAARSRYYLLRGRAMEPRTALILDASLRTGKRLLRQRLDEKELSDAWKQQLAAWIEQSHIPDEILEGDFAVTLDRADLEGVARSEVIKANHLQLIRSSETLEFVRAALRNTDETRPRPDSP